MGMGPETCFHDNPMDTWCNNNVIMTSNDNLTDTWRNVILRLNDVATPFERHNDIIIASCDRSESTPFPPSWFNRTGCQFPQMRLSCEHDKQCLEAVTRESEGWSTLSPNSASSWPLRLTH